MLADAFCHSMVRALVGAVLPVGEGRKPVDWPALVLTSRTRDPHVAVVPHTAWCWKRWDTRRTRRWRHAPGKHGPSVRCRSLETAERIAAPASCSVHAKGDRTPLGSSSVTTNRRNADTQSDHRGRRSVRAGAAALAATTSLTALTGSAS